MNLDKDNKYHVNTVQRECPFAEIESLTTHYQEMTHHISITSLSTTNTRPRHDGNNKSKIILLMIKHL